MGQVHFSRVLSTQSTYKTFCPLSKIVSSAQKSEIKNGAPGALYLFEVESKFSQTHSTLNITLKLGDGSCLLV